MQMIGVEDRILREPWELAEREALLHSRWLAVPGGEDLVLGFFSDGLLVATGSLVGNVLQGIAVAHEFEGEGLASTVVSALLKRALDERMEHIFLYTKPEEAPRFESLGFVVLAAARSRSTGLAAALLEWGGEGITKWKDGLRSFSKGRPEAAGAVVVNCNPFTLGHRRLIEWASRESPWLYVLVVQEDRSVFPFETRIRLVREGTRDLDNVSVLPGGPYVISSATFPTYFTRMKAGESAITELHALLDLELFRQHIAPPLRVRTRFVGTEPYCPVTSVYNETMKSTLPGGDGGVQVRELPRFALHGEAVSASRVRALLREGRINEVKQLVPAATWDWLHSEEAGPVLEKIRMNEGRH